MPRARRDWSRLSWSLFAISANAKPLVFLDGGTFPLSPKSLFPVASLPALSAQVFVGLLVLPAVVSHSDARKSVSPPMFLVVLRR